MATAAFHASRAFAEQMDARDPLARYRDEFLFPKAPDGSDAIYFSGHSLGLQSKRAREYIEQELEDWARLGVEGHFRGRDPWLSYHRLLTEPIARLVGAKPIEVVAMNSLTVNLHLMMVSFYRPTVQRYKIVVEAGAFPSDQYAVKSQLAYHGFDPTTSLIELKPRPGEAILREEDVFSVVEREGSSIALMLLGGVNYSTGQAFDVPAITRVGHKEGCVVAFDLAHAAGNLQLQLHEWDVDFAVWCSYKYLNGGPGAVGGCFVHERHARSTLPRFAGWWGHDEKTRFRMGPEFNPTSGADGWQLSNPPILALAPLRASLEIFDQVGMEALRAKSMALTGYLEYLLDQQPRQSFEIITPRDPACRGTQLSLRIRQNGRSVCDRLTEKGILCDWREPNILRAAPVPLYCSFTDAFRFVEQFVSELG